MEKHERGPLVRKMAEKYLSDSLFGDFPMPHRRIDDEPMEESPERNYHLKDPYGWFEKKWGDIDVMQLDSDSGVLKEFKKDLEYFGVKMEGI